jgi:hypothetical protein
LQKLSLIQGITYNWTDPSLDQNQRIGVLAQSVLAAFPQLVGSTTVNFEGTIGTYYTVDYGGLTAPIISGINQLNLNLNEIASTTASSTPASQSFASSFFSSIFSHIATWLADATNGITKIFAKEVDTNTLCVKKSDGSSVCITGDQLANLLANQASSSPSTSSSGGSSGGSTPDTQAPVVTPNGNNPATITVGAVYSDLGATVTDNVDQNLGYKASVDGGATTTPDQITIDTSTVGTHTILYSATDSAGNTGTATRTVNVVDPNTTQ